MIKIRNAAWLKIFFVSIFLICYAGLEFYERVYIPKMQERSEIESQTKILTVAEAQQKKFLQRVKNEYGSIKNYNAAIERRIKAVEYSLPNELSSSTAFSFLNDLAQKNDVEFLSLNVENNQPDRLTVRVETVGNFFSLQKFFNDVQNSKRAVTIKILEFNDGSLYREQFSKKFIRYAKIDVNFFKFVETTDENFLEE